MGRFLILLVFWCNLAHAATVDGVTFPDTYPIDGQTLVLNGLGLRTLTILNVRAYAAGLYVAQRSHDPRQIIAAPTPKVLLLQFLHAGSKDQVARQFHNGEAVNCNDGSCDPADQSDFDRMVSLAPAVKSGDTFTFVITRAGTRLFVNNALLFQSDKADLGRLILRGYIGDKPPSPDLRKALLG